MYHYVEDKAFLKRMRSFCSDLINQLVQQINNDNTMTVEAHLVGSGAKNLETQNASKPIDLDYNIRVISASKIDINNARAVKEYIRKQFNIVLKKNNLPDCNDSKAVLTTKKDNFIDANKTQFSIDVAIVRRNENWERLIHKKTGVVANDTYCWEIAPKSKGLDDKVAKIKNRQLWNEVRDVYLTKKNMYLKKQNPNHPSFNIYIETINEVYAKYFK
jgi:hypothetical protein